MAELTGGKIKKHMTKDDIFLEFKDAYESDLVSSGYRVLPQPPCVYTILGRAFEKAVVPYLSIPIVNKDEKEFEDWWGNESNASTPIDRKTAKKTWMAARVKK
jgi:hypothetical protein